MSGPRANGRPAILLVEDEAEIVGLMRDFLEAEGFEVHAAASGSAAVAALGRSRIDCVLLDVMLRGESGFDVCRRLRDRSGVPNRLPSIGKAEPFTRLKYKAGPLAW